MKKTEVGTAPIGDSWKLLYEMKSDKCYLEVQEWKDIVSFDEYDLPKFNLNIFPQTLKDFILSVSGSTQTPYDLSAICLIGALSVSLQRKFVVAPNDTWKEPLNTYTTVLMGPSNRKSAVFSLFMSPILKYQQKLEIEYNEQLKENELEISLIEKRIEKLKNDYIKNNDKQIIDDIKKLSKEKNNLLIGSKATFILDNTTEEKLISTMFENNEKVGIFSSEGDLLERFKSLVKIDSHKGDVYLKGYSGDFLRVDRVIRGSEGLYSPALTICLSAQPTVIEEMPQKLIDRGLIARFLLSIPNDNLGRRDVYNAPPLNKELNSMYEKLIQKLLAFECSESISLKLSEEAFKLMKQTEYDIENQFLKNQIYHEELRGWGGKLLGNLLRIAGLIHVAKHAQDTDSLKEVPTIIEAETLYEVFKLKNYFDTHIQKSFGIMRNTTTNEDAKYLLEKVLTLAEKKESYTVDKQKVWQMTKKKFILASTLNKAFNVLIDRGYIQLGFGGISGCKEIVIVNPTILEEYFNTKIQQK